MGKIVFEGEECIKEYAPPPPKREGKDISKMFATAAAKRPKLEEVKVEESQEVVSFVAQAKAGLEDQALLTDNPKDHREDISPKTFSHSPNKLEYISLSSPTKRKLTDHTPSKLVKTKGGAKGKTSPGLRSKDGKIQLGIKGFFK